MHNVHIKPIFHGLLEVEGLRVMNTGSMFLTYIKKKNSGYIQRNEKAFRREMILQPF